MDCFNKAITVVLEHEGGFSNHEADPGGATNYGISLRWLKTQGLYGDLDDDGDVDIDDILAVDLDMAKRIYREKFWQKNHYDRVIDCDVATKIFDMSVNMGATQAHKLLQRALNGLGDSLAVDGIIGPITITAMNTVDPDSLVEALRDEQRRFYLSLIKNRPSLAVFQRGWLRRALA